MSCVKIFLADLLGNQYLFEIPLISFTVKVSDNVVKREFCIKGQCRVFCVIKCQKFLRQVLIE